MMTVEIKNAFYRSDNTSEAWLTQLATNRSRLITLKHPGWQYIPSINAQLKKRGFEIELR